MLPKLLRLSEVQRIVGFRKSSLYKLIAADEFPRPVKIGHASRWVATEIYAWVDNHAKYRNTNASHERADGKRRGLADMLRADLQGSAR